MHLRRVTVQRKTFQMFPKKDEKRPRENSDWKVVVHDWNNDNEDDDSKSKTHKQSNGSQITKYKSLELTF
ncbi:hypothetical protein RUM43_004431 [Polyplax serrata]|uniref:Uncharacterized protein n=1 Tax=Polyplax serrata TaxID=468196 RepID=A0AAN8SBL6_POLSC